MRGSQSPYAWLAALQVVSFLLFTWPYRYVVVLQSETNDCFFLFGKPFLLEFFDHPAALVRYAGRFFGQFYQIPWLGAFLVSAGITCFGFLFSRILKRTTATSAPSQILLPCILLIALHTSPSYLIQDTLGLCLCCATYLAYLFLPGRIAKRVFALAATPVLYLLAGFYVWILVAWIVFFEWSEGPRLRGLLFAVVYGAFSFSIPLAAWRWLFPIPLRSALMCPVLFGPPFRTGWADQTSAYGMTDGALAVLLLAALLLIPFWSRLFSDTSLATFWQTGSDKRTRVALVLATCVLGVLLHLVRYDAPFATVVACRQLYKSRQWKALLEKTQENPHEDHRIQFMTNFALYHEGKLLDEMFRYPQPWGTRGLLLNFTGAASTPGEDDTDDGMYNSDLLFEMGHVNFAFRHAYNCLSLQGKTYENLKRMAECSMVNGNAAMARKYLNLLEKTFFHRDLAGRYRALLADTDAMDRQFGPIRERLPSVDGFGHPTRHFLVLLESKPDNPMALEYLMAWLLLDKTPESLESVSADAWHLKEIGHATLPRHCQEAVLLEKLLTDSPVDLHGFQLDQANITRAKNFRQDMFGQRGDFSTDAARRLYGGTYWFYWFFTTPRNKRLQSSESGKPFRITTRAE